LLKKDLIDMKTNGPLKFINNLYKTFWDDMFIAIQAEHEKKDIDQVIFKTMILLIILLMIVVFGLFFITEIIKMSL
jgi:hypothetical protein